jgi:predicted nucleic-acid-binding Zn-ribbon protein
MKRTSRCPKCDSTDIIADAKALDRSHHSNQTELTLATFRRPEAVLFKGQQETKVSAWVCVQCGFVELYADYPEALKTERH